MKYDFDLKDGSRQTFEDADLADDFRRWHSDEIDHASVTSDSDKESTYTSYPTSNWISETYRKYSKHDMEYRKEKENARSADESKIDENCKDSANAIPNEKPDIYDKDLNLIFDLLKYAFLILIGGYLLPENFHHLTESISMTIFILTGCLFVVDLFILLFFDD